VSFSEVLYAATGAFGWIIIALTALALMTVLVGYARTARAIIRDEGWPAFWQHVRRHVLTRRPRHRR